MMGEEVELCSWGWYIFVVWENKDIYVVVIWSLWLWELQNVECVMVVWVGLGFIIFLQLLIMLSLLEMELCICGFFYINFEFFKVYIMYQVGLMEMDQYIEFFWGVLEMFIQEELCKFIKFVCNQECILFICFCKDGGFDIVYVFLYFMKIVFLDGIVGFLDFCYICVEICMFMIKFFQYFFLEIMLEKFCCVIYYCEDFFSG